MVDITDQLENLTESLWVAVIIKGCKHLITKIRATFAHGKSQEIIIKIVQLINEKLKNINHT